MININLKWFAWLTIQMQLLTISVTVWMSESDRTSVSNFSIESKSIMIDRHQSNRCKWFCVFVRSFRNESNQPETLLWWRWKKTCDMNHTKLKTANSIRSNFKFNRKPKSNMDSLLCLLCCVLHIMRWPLFSHKWWNDHQSERPAAIVLGIYSSMIWQRLSIRFIGVW